MSFSKRQGTLTVESPVVLLRSRTVHEGWGRFLIAKLRLPDGTEIDREIEDHGSAVAVLPYDPERRIVLLVKQMRTPAFFAEGAEAVLEAPAGRLDSDDPEACARREAFEEVGLRLNKLEPVAVAWGMPAVSTERLHMFLAAFTAVDEIALGGGLAEEQEHIVVERRTLPELGRMIDTGELADLKTLALALTLRLRRPELFVE
jgi:nudix-type nucleoside diphosphatase (YffH/AdpP family)